MKTNILSKINSNFISKYVTSLLTLMSQVNECVVVTRLVKFK
jgi:hypothetical protein